MPDQDPKPAWEEKVRSDYRGIIAEEQIEATVVYWRGIIAEAVEAERRRINESVEKMSGFGFYDDKKTRMWIGNGDDCVYIERAEALSIINPKK